MNSMIPQTNQRIVSKGEYAKAQTNRALMGMMSAGLWLTAGLWGAGGIVFVGLSLANKDWMRAAGSVPLILLCLLASIVCGKMGIKALERAKRIDMGVPLTRANTGELPASISLIRASSEPIQTQEAALLRPSLGAAQSPQAEQLLRIVTGEKE